MEDTQKKWLVFISHSHNDNWVAKQIASKLEAEGIKTFLDQLHIAAGEDFEARILEALEHADEFLILLTPWAQESKFVWMEVGVAWHRHIPIVPILHGLKTDEVLVQPGFPITLKKRDMISLDQFDEYLVQLKKRITAQS